MIPAPIVLVHNSPKWLMPTMCFSRIFVSIARQIKRKIDTKKRENQLIEINENNYTNFMYIFFCIFLNCGILFGHVIVVVVVFFGLLRFSFQQWRQFSLAIENEYKWNEEVRSKHDIRDQEKENSAGIILKIGNVKWSASSHSLLAQLYPLFHFSSSFFQ